MGLALAAAAGGCGPGSFGIGSRSVSACFRAIPAARSDVHEAGAVLEGVHRISPGAIGRHHGGVHLLGLRRSGQAVCAVALHGPFVAGQVGGAPAGAAGTYAVVFVTSDSLRVLGAVVFDHVPHAFGGRTF